MILAMTLFFCLYQPAFMFPMIVRGTLAR
jgi:hypothetical protein